MCKSIFGTSHGMVFSMVFSPFKKTSVVTVRYRLGGEPFIISIIHRPRPDPEDLGLSRGTTKPWHHECGRKNTEHSTVKCYCEKW